MAQYWKNHLSDMWDEESITGLIAYAIKNGKALFGYYNLPYINMHMGKMQIICKAKNISEDDDNLCVYSVDTHGIGRCVWDVEIVDCLQEDSDDKLKKTILARTPAGNGLAVINVVNADVLPTYREDEHIKMQMIAYVNHMDFYESEDEYADSLPDEENKKKTLLGDGCIFPAGLLMQNIEEHKDTPIDSTFVRGTVKGTFWGTLKIDDEEENLFLKTVIETEFGELELIHSPSAIKEDQGEKVHPGSLVVANVVLSGDPAIYEYTNGIVFDEKNNLHLLADVLEGGDPERTRCALSENVHYYSETSQKSIVGRENVIARMKFINQACEEKRFVEYVKIDEYNGKSADNAFAPGAKCLALSYEERENVCNLVFIKLDSDSKIEQIYFSVDTGYTFSTCEE